MNRALQAAALLAMGLAVSSRGAADDLVRFDFETGDLQGWQVVEGALDKIVSDRNEFHNGGRYNKQGKYYLSTVEEKHGSANDRMMGVVESPLVVLTGPRISMLVGGGDFPETYVALCLRDGKEVRQARGQKTETLMPVEWSVPELVGQTVFLRVVDHATSGWGHVTLDDVAIQGRIDPEATRAHFARVERGRLQAEIRRQLKQVDFAALRLAIEDLVRTFPREYAQGKRYLEELPKYAQRAKAVEALLGDDPASLERARQQLDEIIVFQRTALVANPLVCGRPLLLVVRNQYRLGGHHAIDTLFHTGEINTNRFQGGGALKTFDVLAGKSAVLLDAGRDGLIRDPEVHFDGRRIVFAWRRGIDEDYHIWEIGADGTGLRQLTSAAGVSDFDPFYLPDDHIAFSSTREPKYNQCSRDIAANVFRMEPDGANIHQIGKNNLFDNHGTLTPDGRILYARWEYVDRNFGDAHGIWTVNPDGTNQAIYWGNNKASPAAVYYPRIIPGTQQLACIFGMHHNRLWGAMAIVDRRLGLDGREPVVRIWPPEAIERVRAGGPFDCDSFNDVYPKYECPWPLSDKYFLCSRMTMRPGQAWIEGDARFGHEMGIYLVDVFGNEVLVHVEGPGCYDPMPLGPSLRPPVLPARRDFDGGEGVFYVADVYQGTHVQGVARGAVKSLRVVEAPEKRHWSRGSWNGQGYTAPGMNWHSLENKRILGTVPVEEDGSAFFAVPSERFVYFQLLDADGMMIQSMRSGANVQSGEQIACYGCHDERRTSPPTDGRPSLALRRPPSRLTGWYGPARDFGFMAEVQPVFTRHCVECHDYGKEAGKKLNLAPDRTLTFNTAYMELWRKKYVHCIGGGPAEIQPAYSWGSHTSKLVEVLRTPNYRGHENLRLTREELDRIVTWIDINGVYYSTYASAYPESLTGRVPLTPDQLEQLSGLTGVAFARQRHFLTNRGPEVSFERPELSPCLAGLDRNDPKYRQALAIIQAGKEMLARRPRADMPGFIPCEKDLKREEKFAMRRQIELRNRQAIRAGTKVYDDPSPGPRAQ